MPSIILAFTCVRWQRQSNLALSKYVADAIQVIKAAQYDIIILELLNGQSDTEIMDHSDVSLYVMTPEFGAATQLEKSTCLILLTW
jgi:methylmalonyl-CoA mutase